METNDIKQIAEALAEQLKPKKEKKKKEANPYYCKELAQQFTDDVLMDKLWATCGAVHWNNTTYLYDGKRYHAIDEKAFNHLIRQYLLDKKIPFNNAIIGNIVPIVNTLTWVDAHEYPKMPFYRGVDEAFPKANNIIAYNNGLLDLDAYLKGNKTLLPHTPLWVSPVCLPYDFDPDATCPQWETFLGQVFPDGEQIWTLQEFFGLCLTHDTSMQKFMIWAGLTRGGKGTTWEVLRRLLGEEATAGFTLHQFRNTFGLYPLVGKLAAYCGEVELKGCNERGMILETLKGIVGEDTMPIDKKYGDQFSTVLPTRLIIACNDLPSFAETTGALSSRLLLLKFNVSFLGREDYTLKDKLVTEISGINNWALKGLARLRANGRFTIPAITQQAIREFMRNNSPTLAFIQDRLVVNSALNSGNLIGVELSDEPLSVYKKTIQDAYLEWFEAEGIDISEIKWNYFWQRMASLVPNLKAKPNTRGDKKLYLGIDLKNPLLSQQQLCEHNPLTQSDGKTDEVIPKTSTVGMVDGGLEELIVANTMLAV